MTILRIILLNIMSFCAGGMAFINLTDLIPGTGIGYEAAWWKVAIFILITIQIGIISHLQARNA